MSQIQDFHAHVYYDETTFNQARKLVSAARRHFLLPVGHMHRKPVGPHPCWSCQLTISVDLFGKVIPWLALNRKGLVIYIHAETGDDLKDHTEHALWMGEIKPLKLSIFDQSDADGST